MGSRSDLYCDIVIDLNYFVDKERYTLMMGVRRLLGYTFERVWG